MLRTKRLPNGHILAPRVGGGNGQPRTVALVEITPDHPDFSRHAADADRDAEAVARQEKLARLRAQRPANL